MRDEFSLEVGVSPSAHADKNVSDSVEALYRQYAPSLYLLYYIHTCSHGEAQNYMKEQVGDWRTSAKNLSTVESGQVHILRQCHLLCMQFYTRKLRKKQKTENLKKTNPPFSVTPQLISILQLPSNCKSLLVLCVGLGLSPKDAGEILHCSTAHVSKKLDQIQQRLNMDLSEIGKILSDISVPDKIFSNLFDRLLLDYSEKGYAGKRRLSRFKRRMDQIVPFAAAGILLFLLFAFLAVHFGWLGTLN